MTSAAQLSPTPNSATPNPPAGPSASMAPVNGKARPGELRARIAKALVGGAPGAQFSVTELVNMLGHSGGAIGNACETLVRRGEAVRVGFNPRMYRATATTAAAAAHATAPGPPGPAHTPPAPPSTARPTPAVGPPGGRPGPVTRPNGQQYHPRALANLPDVEALRRLREAGVPVLLYGPPGTGKTSLIEAAFPDLITVAGDGDTTVGDLIGEYTQDQHGGYEFIYGPLVTAMQEGRALLLDDATLISPKVLAALYPAMDGRRQIQGKAHKGETITAAEGFYVIAGHNPGVHGAVLTEALASRFSVQIQVGSDYDLATALKINRTAVRIARNLATCQQAGEVGWAPQLRELIAFQKIADVLGAEAAFANLVGIAPLEDRDTVAEIVTKALGKPVTALSLGRQL
ncbi:ATPase associated with various cellular activities AAA_5 [Streptomyces violaceusniger Tu 4113]|uniref:ATPase associated with various cellular activities AAA_5 n=1 Tax=Streptomyces violaceusniger (strain Tu 4113) TaxID=653045 RepID=G2NYS9_STRV4|nr:ATPase associated with various cellular activities AAA_5 [Streptomyces violaceusniger Tu 4113]